MKVLADVLQGARVALHLSVNDQWDQTIGTGQRRSRKPVLYFRAQRRGLGDDTR